MDLLHEQTSEAVALVLAAGRASRMGADKIFLPWGETTVLAATVFEVSRAGFRRVLVVTRAEHEGLVRNSLRGLPVEIVINERAATGLHSSIRAGLAAAGAVSSFAVCLGDQPTVPAALYARLRDILGTAALAAPVYEGRRGNPVMIAGHLIPEILAHADDDRGCAYLFKRHEAVLLEVEDPSVVQDLDTPEDYRALKAAAFGV